MEGWIKLDRKILDWEWYGDANMVYFFIHLLVTANHEDSKWRGIEVKRGQVVSGRTDLHVKTGLSEQVIRTCLKKLKKSGSVKVEATNKYSIITICNYDKYQIEANGNQPTDNQQLTNNQPTDNQQLTTNKNDKNEINNLKESTPIGVPKKSVSLAQKREEIEKKLMKEKNDFVELLRPFVEIYGREMVNEFFLYWTEPNKSNTKMRFQLEKTWDIGRRLQTWDRNRKAPKGSNSSKKPSDPWKRDDTGLEYKKF